MVVDDERVIADTITAILCSYGHTARAAYSGEEATLLTEDFKPQAVISDVILPGMTGIDLAIWLEYKCPDCKVLLISGNGASFDPTDHNLHKGHLHTILPKPIHPKALLQFVANCRAASV
jgi:DNA-binding NtrC family response regulator